MRDLAPLGPGGLNLLSVSEAAREMEGGGISSVRLVEDCLARIEARDGDLNAWTWIDREHALAQARLRDAQPRRGPLHGIPVGIKDIFDTLDMPTAYGSPIHEGHRPAVDTALVTAFRTAGAVIMGKTLTTEFASPVPRGTRNPHDLARNPGVSSSGSAAAVADFHVPMALGSQTGGSTILPAAFCGVVGFKASLAGLDRGGIRHLRPSLDTMGLFARTVGDIALMRAALTGTEAEPSPADVSGLRIGVCRTVAWKDAQPETVAALEAVTRALNEAGAIVTDAQMPESFIGIERSFRTISSFEGARALQWEAATHPDLLNDWIRAGQEMARTIDAAGLEAAHQHAVECRRLMRDMFRACDLIVTPSTSGEAPADLVGVSDSAFNRIWTLMHVPCATIPAGTGPNGMPVGVQLVGPAGSDARTLALVQAVAQVVERGC